MIFILIFCDLLGNFTLRTICNTIIIEGGFLMELFSEFKNIFNSERDNSHVKVDVRRNRKVIKLIEPNYGRIVTLQVMEEEPVLSMTIDMLTIVNEYQNTSVTTSGNVVTFTFEDATLANELKNILSYFLTI